MSVCTNVVVFCPHDLYTPTGEQSEVTGVTVPKGTYWFCVYLLF